MQMSMCAYLISMCGIRRAYHFKPKWSEVLTDATLHIALQIAVLTKKILATIV